eukprot:gene4898-5371_t
MFIIIIFLLIIAIASSAASIESNKKDNKNNPPLPCPSYTTIKEFHNLITLPEVAVPNKISFRSCVSRKRETVVASIEGPGCVKLFWIVLGTGNKDRPERCVRTQDAMMMILRIYYDDSSTPSVEAPLGAFFGIYHNREDSWGNTKSGYGADNSLFKISENGAFTLIAPLPFEKRIKITLVNEDPQNVSMRAWAQVSYDMYDPNCPFPETLRFQAIYRMEDRRQLKSIGELHEYKRSYHVGHARGSGYLLGFTLGLTMNDRNDFWFHNGAEIIVLDHSTNPRVLKGTGGEDLFGTSCFFEKHHNFPDWGFMYGNNNETLSAYRWFISQFRLPFTSEFSFDFGASRDFVQTVLYWYQRGPVLALNKHLPSLAQRFGESTTADISKNNPMLPPPTGFISYWNISRTMPIALFEKAIGHLRAARTNYRSFLRPTFGFLSVGEYIFTYHTNEGYPKDVFLWARGIYTVRQLKHLSNLTLYVTHDDPLVVYINGHIVYREVNSLSGFHSFRVDTKKMKLGQNEFLVQFANRDNTNSRAFLFGLQLHLSDHLRNGRLRKVIYQNDRLIQQRGVGKLGEPCTR